jgi:hypothetical protein
MRQVTGWCAIVALAVMLFGVINITVGQVQANECPETLPFGIIFTCSVRSIGEFNEYTFSAQINDRFLFRIARTSGNLDPYFLIIDPLGNTLCSTYTYQDTATADCTANRAGIHTLRVRDSNGQNGTNIGNYSFYAQKVNAVSNAKSISFGTPMNGSIVDIIQSNTYTFSAKQNDQIRLQIVRNTGDLDPYFYVYNSQGSTLNNCSNYTYADYAYRNCTINADGTYSIMTGDGSIDGTGTYTLRLQRYNAPGGSNQLNLGQLITATISAAAESDVFALDLDINDKLIIRMLATSGNLDPEWYLTNSAGTSVCETYSYATIAAKDDCTINAAGKYYLFVEDAGDIHTGDYRLRVQRVNAPGQAITLNSGRTVNGALEADAEFDTYTIAALVDSEIKLNLTCTAGGMQAWMRLYNATGSLVAENYTYQMCSALQLNHTPTTTGTYTLIISDSNSEGVGNYTLRLAPLLNQRVFIPLVRR